MKRTTHPRCSWRLSCCLRSIVWCRLRCSLTKNSVCRLRSSTWWLRCNLRCCSLLCWCRFTALCLQIGLYKLHTHEIYEEMTIVQSMEILTAFDLASFSLLCHGVSPVMPVLHPLALCPSFWLFKIFFSLLSWSVRWFIHLRSDRSRLVSLNPLRLARHWLYYLFISFNKCLFQVTRMHIVLHYL